MQALSVIRFWTLFLNDRELFDATLLHTYVYMRINVCMCVCTFEFEKAIHNTIKCKVIHNKPYKHHAASLRLKLPYKSTLKKNHKKQLKQQQKIHINKCK